MKMKTSGERATREGGSFMRLCYAKNSFRIDMLSGKGTNTLKALLSPRGAY